MTEKGVTSKTNKQTKRFLLRCCCSCLIFLGLRLPRYECERHLSNYIYSRGVLVYLRILLFNPIQWRVNRCLFFLELKCILNSVAVVVAENAIDDTLLVTAGKCHYLSVVRFSFLFFSASSLDFFLFSFCFLFSSLSSLLHLFSIHPTLHLHWSTPLVAVVLLRPIHIHFLPSTQHF